MGAHSALRQAAREMRNVYANEIARAVYEGRVPEPFTIESWARYDAEARHTKPAHESKRETSAETETT